VLRLPPALCLEGVRSQEGGEDTAACCAVPDARNTTPAHRNLQEGPGENFRLLLPSTFKQKASKKTSIYQQMALYTGPRALLPVGTYRRRPAVSPGHWKRPVLAGSPSVRGHSPELHLSRDTQEALVLAGEGESAPGRGGGVGPVPPLAPRPSQACAWCQAAARVVLELRSDARSGTTRAPAQARGRERAATDTVRRGGLEGGSRRGQSAKPRRREKEKVSGENRWVLLPLELLLENLRES